MQFIANGPSIPDDLLIARDEGRVIFFCGAGVSRARAKLDDFFGLAEAVAKTLAVPSDSPVKQLLELMRNSPYIEGIGSPFSADRVFALLEQHFRTSDIYEAIAKALTPAPNVDLSAHSVLLDLSRGPDNKVRLVTTNFDLLFEACDGSLTKFGPRKLPDSNRPDEIDGIVHLHGHLTDDYSRVAGEGLIISSSEFGRAYLSERWATDFVRSILDSFVVVFIGYTADDPPMQYLLEGLSRKEASKKELYAFQSGSIESARARWEQKGVDPIVYESENDHSALWDTLAAWATRARNPEQWYADVIAKAQYGPEQMAPHERGQVAHVVSTIEGARRFAQAPVPPPAEWLCVFDSSTRFAEPGKLRTWTEDGPHFDPFDAYGLDSDPVPARSGDDDDDDAFSKRREIPPGAWSAFELTRRDRLGLNADQVSAARGHWSVNMPRLIPRLSALGVWISRVFDQPATVWWASNQTGLHEEIQHQIRMGLQKEPGNARPEIRKAWRLLLESWHSKPDDIYGRWFELNAEINAAGWSEGLVRRFAEMHRPFIKTKRPFDARHRPPSPDGELHLRLIVDADVEYPALQEAVTVPNEYLAQLVYDLRLNLRLGVALEREVGGFGLEYVSSLHSEDDHEEGGSGQRLQHGISISVSLLLRFFRLLMAHDEGAARHEVAAWQSNRDPVFTRLKVWAAGDSRLADADCAATAFITLEDRSFWNERLQRDLLFALSRRWNALSLKSRRKIEARLLRGRKPWANEKAPDFRRRKAREVLDRIHWLSSQGCNLGVDLQEVTKRLRAIEPRWEPELADRAVASLDSRAQWVTTDTDDSQLASVPISEIIKKSEELSGRRGDFFVERDPYGGMVSSRPVRAFAALTYQSKRGNIPKGAWESFLRSPKRETDPTRLIWYIARRISTLPAEDLSALARSVSDWLQKIGKRLIGHSREQFDGLWSALIAALRTDERAGASAIVRGRNVSDWPTEAINAPVGIISQVMFDDPNLPEASEQRSLPDWWLSRAEELLALPGDMRRHAIVIFAHNSKWLYFREPSWTERHLLSVMNTEDKEAFWSGFFWRNSLPQADLYLRMKPALLGLAHQASFTRRQHAESLAAMLLAGWRGKREGTDDRFVSDDEMRSILLDVDDEFRTQVVWQLDRWTREDDSDWSDETLSLLRSVGPRQMGAKSPLISARLCELAFSQGKKFPAFVDAILPLVVPMDQDLGSSFPILRRQGENVVDEHPEEALSLLSAVLAEDVRKWPYGSGEIVERLAKVAPALKTDIRLVRLQRRWAGR